MLPVICCATRFKPANIVTSRQIRFLNRLIGFYLLRRQNVFKLEVADSGCRIRRTESRSYRKCGDYRDSFQAVNNGKVVSVFVNGAEFRRRRKKDCPLDLALLRCRLAVLHYCGPAFFQLTYRISWFHRDVDAQRTRTETLSDGHSHIDSTGVHTGGSRSGSHSAARFAVRHARRDRLLHRCQCRLLVPNSAGKGYVRPDGRNRAMSVPRSVCRWLRKNTHSGQKAWRMLSAKADSLTGRALSRPAELHSAWTGPSDCAPTRSCTSIANP